MFGSLNSSLCLLLLSCCCTKKRVTPPLVKCCSTMDHVNVKNVGTLIKTMLLSPANDQEPQKVVQFKIHFVVLSDNELGSKTKKSA